MAFFCPVRKESPSKWLFTGAPRLTAVIFRRKFLTVVSTRMRAPVTRERIRTRDETANLSGKMVGKRWSAKNLFAQMWLLAWSRGEIEIGGGNIKILLQLHRDNYHQYEERKKEKRVSTQVQISFARSRYLKDCFYIMKVGKVFFSNFPVFPLFR